MPKDYADMRAAILRDLDGLRYEVDAKKQIGWLILDRPPLNVVSYRGRSQIAAIMELLDRGYGKATQPLSGDPDGPPLAVDFRWADAPASFLMEIPHTMRMRNFRDH